MSDFCAHRLHCNECHEQTVALVQNWQSRVATLERERESARQVSMLKDDDRLRLQAERDEAHAAIRSFDKGLKNLIQRIRFQEYWNPSMIADDLDNLNETNAPAIRQALEAKQ